MGPKIEIIQGVTLRIFEREDVPFLFDTIQRNKEHLIEWRVWYERLNTKKNVQLFIDENKRQCESLLNDDNSKMIHPGFQCGLFTEDGKVIGMVGYQGINLHNKVAALGYWIDETWQGKGIMTKSAQNIIEYGWDVLDIHRYEIQAWVENKQSVALAKRLGFVHESILKEIEYRDGIFLDHDLYRLLPSDLIGFQK